MQNPCKIHAKERHKKYATWVKIKLEIGNGNQFQETTDRAPQPWKERTVPDISQTMFTK